MTSSTDDLTFLFSDTTDNPSTFFQGYCFYGSDYIYGELGGEEYLEATGKSIPAGQDGCYVSVEKRHGRYTFSTDYHGYKKVFYYWNDGVWIVSNSIYRIYEQMKLRGLRVRPRYSQLAAFPIPGPIFNQMASFDAVIEGIKLLPTGCTLEIGAFCPPVVLKVSEESETLDYRESLSTFLNVWVSRMETLLTHDSLTVTADITGGIDSRANLAMFLKARERLGMREYVPQFRCGAIAGNQKDLEVARVICEQNDLPLNQKIEVPRKKYSSAETIEVWRDLSLGCYSPVYLPRVSPSPQAIHFNGGGGELYRPFYDQEERFESIDQFLESFARKLEPSWLKYEFVQDTTNTFNQIIREEGITTYKDALKAHYRLFRHRFHTGRSPQYGVVFTPLGSNFIEPAAKTIGNALTNSGQINYDLIASLNEDLLKIPFDMASKSPSEAVLQSLTRVDVEKDPAPGEVYLGNVQPVSPQPSQNADLFKQFDDLLSRAIDGGFAGEFWGETFVEKARTVSRNAQVNKKFRHAADARPVSSIIAASLFFD